MTKHRSLLEIAKSFEPKKRNGHFSDDEMELAVAYVNGEVNTAQIRKAFEAKGYHRNYLYRMSAVIRAGVASGRIEPLILKRR
jgi:hypothetical protein